MTTGCGSGETPMNAVLRDVIQRHGGAIPFVQAMELLLYHPQHGYYMGNRPRLGRGGDFVTAPEMTSLFGELLALQFAEIWQRMGCPDLFQVLETGAGSGRLALDILNTAQRLAGFGAALRYAIVEVSEDFRTRQQALLADKKVLWYTDLQSVAAAGGVSGAIFGNEVLDAFPVHWVTMTGEGLRELWVVAGEGGWTIREGALSDGELADYFERRAIHLAPGYRTEVGLAAARWLEQLAGCLRQGVVVMIDYGFPGHELYHEHRTSGTLVGYHQNRQVADPLAWPGEMDLTSHVDFTAMALAGGRAGLDVLGFTSQSWFLMGLGLLDRLAQQEGVLPDDALAVLRQAVMRLLMPGGMGERFQVLAMGRGMPAIPPLSGFNLNNRVDRLRLSEWECSSGAL